VTVQSKLRKLYAQRNIKDRNLEERLAQLEVLEKMLCLEKIVKEAKKRSISTADAEKELYVAEKQMLEKEYGGAFVVSSEEVKYQFCRLRKKIGKEAENELQMLRHNIQELIEKLGRKAEPSIEKPTKELLEEDVDVVCGGCNALVPASSKKCPYCGAVFLWTEMR